MNAQALETARQCSTLQACERAALINRIDVLQADLAEKETQLANLEREAERYRGELAQPDYCKMEDAA